VPELDTPRNSNYCPVVQDRSIPLGEYLGPWKPCPFCGSTDIGLGCWEEIVCKTCGAEAPWDAWQFRVNNKELEES